MQIAHQPRDSEDLEALEQKLGTNFAKVLGTQISEELASANQLLTGGGAVSGGASSIINTNNDRSLSIGRVKLATIVQPSFSHLVT